MKQEVIDRFWEVDLFRGIAISMMIIYHFLFDLNFIKNYQIPLHSLPFLLFLYPIGTLFLLLVGISLTISYNKAQNSLSQKQIFLKFIRRGLFIFGLGLLVTVVTWILLPRGFIVFGVLHCIGLSVILAYPFLRFKFSLFIPGILFVILGIILRSIQFNFSWFLWLGFIPYHFYTLDYFPLLPWFGVVLIGIMLGNYLYPCGKRRSKINDYSKKLPVKGLCFLGRHSLIIYLVHQLILVGIIYLFL
ncbi:MAG: heparan-alpha-glucosaminide N-acetyltransferase [Euryarchaeota archaeon]|nr:heparan-alpha-glucosaminide N-acetyltransferase [Euryarchaeota archaeon]